MPYYQAYECHRGEAFDITFTNDETATGWDVEFSLYSTPTSTTPLFTRAVGSGVTISGTTITVALTASNTDRAAGSYWWALTYQTGAAMLAHGVLMIKSPQVG
jgi:hypothetical protein